MPQLKLKPELPLTGLWHIILMEPWDEDYIHGEGQAFIEFEENGTGHFQFGYVKGGIDWRQVARDGEPAIEWSGEGQDDMDPAHGRGWAKLKDDELHGMIFIHMHMADDSSFEAIRPPQPPGIVHHTPYTSS